MPGEFWDATQQAKMLFLRSSIEYLGHVVDAEGIHPTEEKVKAIKEAPAPTNVTQLRSFLGLVNYYNKFLPNLAANLTPLYSLLSKHQQWAWNDEQQVAFQRAKDALQSDALLTHYDPAKPLVLACDASDYGVGAVLSHIVDSGKERPIAYISRTLSAAEKHYSQLEKEALAIIFAVKKFHRYLIGRHFTIESDHQPLKTLFGETIIPEHGSLENCSMGSYFLGISVLHPKGSSSKMQTPRVGSLDHYLPQMTVSRQTSLQL